MSRAANSRSKFAELKALRKSGKKAFDTYNVDEATELYEEVDEDRYKKIVRQRLDQDDFVVDDNGEGYADDGREEWDRVPQYETDSEAENHMPTKRGKNSKKQQQGNEDSKQQTNDRNISEYFTKGNLKAQPKAKIIKTEADDDFLSSLLGEVDTNIPAPDHRRSSKPHRSSEKRRARALSPAPENVRLAPKRTKITDHRLPSPSPAEDALMSDDGIHTFADDDAPIMDDIPTSDAVPAPSSPMVQAAERRARPKKEVEESEDEDMMEVAHAATIATASVNLSSARVPKKVVKVDSYPSPAASSPPAKATEPVVLNSSEWNDINQSLNVVSSSASAEPRSHGKIDYKDAIEEDGSLNFFWTDYTEVNGSLCLFGKVLNKKTKNHVSCFVKVDNIERKLFFLPRKYRTENGQETSDEVGMVDVFTEIGQIMSNMNVTKYRMKKCERKYAFEMADVPKEAQYMKLFYPYSKNQIDKETTGETFSHVFGTNTALFEQFVLWKNIMGPCWLKIEDADFSHLKNASHCKLEVLVEHPNMVSTVANGEALDAPPLTLMSVAMRTTFNAKDNKQEILALSARIYEDVSLNDTTPADKLPCRTFTLVRPNGTNFPLGFEKMASERKKGLVKAFKQESEMFAFFLAQIDVVDPDVILGHGLEGVDYSVLLNRLHEKKVFQWSRLGRLRRSQWPASILKVGGNVFAERQIMAGRLLCDLANDAGKSAMYKCATWSLTEMCSLYLSGNNKRRDIDNEAALNTWATTKDGLMDYVSHLETDTYFITALALKVQLLPLTKVLTNLAGNSWARTLTGTRAERNEYILLHEFHRNKYICPDKQTFKGVQKQEDANGDEEGSSSKKDKYKGGLVFEPVKGLYDKFVLVMDFNSLYPSIIQEFNICFTTVDRTSLSEDDEQVPKVPVEQEQGILPKLIATLVSRRRQVKSLMKDKNATTEQLATWEIKQLALKLTANSMYGCLGYTKSRFYARPLAVLTTHKGREILQSTKALAESNSLEVIYGDTDSVMINANVDNVADAFKVGNEFKKAVNERYRLLEIDIDNIFRRILLQAKKKYAAINMVEADGRWIEKMEVKGLDMKRREFCSLAKEISSRLLNDILSGDDSEVSVQRIHEYLRETAGKMREQAIPAQKYIIFTQLGKAPKEYPNGNTMPQVQVALRELARGKMVRKGDVISYIVTGDPQSSESVAARSYTPQDVLKPDSGFVPDVEWYIGKQIFPPVERLCANIVGTSPQQLAECLGLDIRKYASVGGGHGSGNGLGGGADLEIHPLESQIPDNVRFADCARIHLRCRACKVVSATPFEGLLGLTSPPPSEPTTTTPPSSITATGIICPSCTAPIPNLSIVAQVEHAIRLATARYYEGWLICDDVSCGNRTRQISVAAGARCLGPRGLARDCMGTMRYVVSGRDVYNQLLYFASLWDVEKARAAVEGSGGGGGGGGGGVVLRKEEVCVLAEQNRVRFGTVKGVVDRYLDKCGRQWVAMDRLFEKLGFRAV